MADLLPAFDVFALADAARMAAAARDRLGTRFGEKALRCALIAAYSGGYAIA